MVGIILRILEFFHMSAIPAEFKGVAESIRCFPLPIFKGGNRRESVKSSVYLNRGKVPAVIVEPFCFY